MTRISGIVVGLLCLAVLFGCASSEVAQQKKPSDYLTKLGASGEPYGFEMTIYNRAGWFTLDKQLLRVRRSFIDSELLIPLERVSIEKESADSRGIVIRGVAYAASKNPELHIAFSVNIFFPDSTERQAFEKAIAK